jgi:glycosyltransferase involved in cell wall biosynthesis
VSRIRDIVVAGLMLLVLSPFLLILRVVIRQRNESVVEEQLRATLPVNPRPTAETFTKYSLPSKNMEYMASGTPLLTTLLPGMPKEYLRYVYVLGDESPAGIAAEIDGLLALDLLQLRYKGQEAKEFALKRQNKVVQARRVARLIESCGGSSGAGGS